MNTDRNLYTSYQNVTLQSTFNLLALAFLVQLFVNKIFINLLIYYEKKFDFQERNT